jgi:hypothetical protein
MRHSARFACTDCECGRRRPSTLTDSRSPDGNSHRNQHRSNAKAGTDTSSRLNRIAAHGRRVISSLGKPCPLPSHPAHFNDEPVLPLCSLMLGAAEILHFSRCICVSHIDQGGDDEQNNTRNQDPLHAFILPPRKDLR